MERLVDLDPQLLHDTILLALAVFVLFTLMSCLLFDPVRKLLEDRKERIRSDIERARMDREEAAEVRREYEVRLRDVEKKADEILSEAHRKARRNEARIVAEAKEEAGRIVWRANEDAELSKVRVQDEMKQEMISIAAMMAGKVVAANLDTTIRDALAEETLREIGESTWQS